ncbi:hypothetical protein M422DRAFT_28195 [Sphaerobolus stellatus SS14]|nr:hypothetical protein M422DRAFT_28195 [Sphaerobolus stellatus SS14]
MAEVRRDSILEVIEGKKELMDENDALKAKVERLKKQVQGLQAAKPVKGTSANRTAITETESAWPEASASPGSSVQRNFDSEALPTSGPPESPASSSAEFALIFPTEITRLPVTGSGGLHERLFSAELELAVKRLELRDTLAENTIMKAELQELKESGKNFEMTPRSIHGQTVKLNETKGTQTTTPDPPALFTKAIQTMIPDPPIPPTLERSTSTATEVPNTDHIMCRTRLKELERQLGREKNVVMILMHGMEVERRERLEAERSRLNAETARENERLRCLEMQKIMQGVLSEANTPFIVPPLLEAFIQIFRSLSDDVGKDDDDIMMQEY